MLNYFIARPVEDPAAAAAFKRQLQWMLFLRVVILTLLLGINLALQSAARNIIIPPFYYVVFFIGAVNLYTICSALLLKFIRRYTTFAYGEILGDVLLISLLIYYSGGSESIFTILYFFPIIAGSFILLRRGGLAPAAASTIAYGIILTLEYTGHHPVFFDEFWYRPLSDIRSLMNLFSIHGLTFFITAILSGLLSEKLRRTEKALMTTTLKYDQLAVLYKKIFDDIPSGIIVVNQHNIVSLNPAAEKITGYEEDEITGRDITRIFPGLRLDAAMLFRPELIITRKDGKNIPIGYSFATLNMPGTDDKYELITLQDLSETKQMEKQVLQAEKMATIGEMAAGIAHELRNPLAAISGAAELLDACGDVQPQNQGLMNIINRECARLQSTISEFLAFSKPMDPEKEFIPLLPLVKEMIQILQHTQDWPEKCTAAFDIPEKMDCWADPQQLQKILLNLLHNSCLALRKRSGGEIRVTAREAADETGAERTVMTVSDNGPGIPAHNIDKIFEPFFTTRENGTGLGLAIVKQIVNVHDGSITINSRENGGTTVEIWLPLP